MTVSEIPHVQETVPHWLLEPFKDASPERLVRLRAELERIGFTEAQISKRAGVASIYELTTLPAENPLAHENDALAVAVRLLVVSRPVKWSMVWSALGADFVDVLSSLGLLLSVPTDSGADSSHALEPRGDCLASISLYPIGGTLIAGDRHSDLGPMSTGIPKDIVYTAMTDDARQFVHLMPRVPCKDYLELCSGTGVAALIAAGQFAERAWGVDVAARSTRFAQFNAVLNGLDNATMLTGDLYEPLAGQTFDVITAHPPYVPAMANSMVYRDGGADGEEITRRIIVGVPVHLRPGGLFYGRCMMTDRKGRPIETRIREMLGPAESEFDLMLAQGNTFDMLSHLEKGVKAGRETADEAAAMRRLFGELEVERFVGVAFVLHRRANPAQRKPITARRLLSPKTEGSHLLWYLKWCEVKLEYESDPSRYLDTRPQRVNGIELRARSLLEAGRWTVTNAALVTKAPFVAEGDCPPWFATLLTWCDGAVTAREHLERARELEFFGSTFTDADFGTIIRELADGGLIELDVCPLPASRIAGV